MNKGKELFTTRNLCFCAILIALLIIMSLTPLGYLRVGIVEISFMMLPIVVGSIFLGPWAGALLGFIFGITSYAQCLTGASPFGAVLYNIDPIATAILCLIPRILAGMIPGFFASVFIKKDSTRLISYAALSLLGALLNTVLFIGGLMLLFGRTEYISSFGNGFWGIVWALVGINGIIEAIVCCIVGGGISKALDSFVFKIGAKAHPKLSDNSGK